MISKNTRILCLVLAVVFALSSALPSMADEGKKPNAAKRAAGVVLWPFKQVGKALGIGRKKDDTQETAAPPPAETQEDGGKDDLLIDPAELTAQEIAELSDDDR